MFELVYTLDGRIERHLLNPGETVVGREALCDLVIVHPSMSRRHARFTVTSKDCEVTDLASVNGTFVNGRRIARARLTAGDVIVLGTCELHLYLRSEVGSVSPSAPRAGSTDDPPTGSIGADLVNDERKRIEELERLKRQAAARRDTEERELAEQHHLEHLEQSKCQMEAERLRALAERRRQLELEETKRRREEAARAEDRRRDAEERMLAEQRRRQQLEREEAERRLEAAARRRAEEQIAEERHRAVQKFLQRADASLKREDFARADDLIRQALALDPEDRAAQALREQVMRALDAAQPGTPMRAAPPTSVSPQFSRGVWGRLKDAATRIFDGSRLPRTTRTSDTASRHQPSPERTTGNQPSEVDPVLLGVSAPRHVRPSETFSAQFVAYVQELEGAVRQQLAELSGSTPGKRQTVLGLPPTNSARWVVGTPVAVRVTGEHLTVQSPSAAFHWNGQRNLVSFLVTVRADAPETTTHLCFEAFIGGVAIAFVPIPMMIGPRATVTEPVVVSTRPFSTAFASYASADAALVALGLSWLKRWDVGLDVFMDCLDLTPNERWQRELKSVIPTKDVFLLFWSVNAMKSPWVRWELQTARSAKGEQSIRPMPLEDPDIAPPPPELSHLQFRDRYLMARQGFLRLQELKE